MRRVASLYLPHWSIDRIARAGRRAQPQPESATIDLAPLVAGVDAERVLQCDAPKNTGWRPGARWARAEDNAARRARAEDNAMRRERAEDESAARRAPPDDDGAMPRAGGDVRQEMPQPLPWSQATRADVARQVAALPAHRRPPMREMGRRSEAAAMPFRALPGDDGGTTAGWTSPALAEPVGDVPHSPFAGLDPAADDRAAAAIARWNVIPAIRYPGDGPHPDKHARRGSNDPHAAPPGVAAFFDTGRTTADTIARVCPERPAPHAAHGRDDAMPLVTVHRIGSRVEIAAASSAATALGLTAGMALTQARASVPGLDVRDADPAGDRADLDRLALLVVRRWCPVVAIDGADGLLLDVTGVAHLHGGERQMARRLLRLLARAGFTARIAIADTAGAAWALARHGARGDALVLAPDTQVAALAPLPVAALRLDAAAVELLARLGVDTIGDLAAMPRAPLVRRFGAAVARRLDQASGAAAEPFDPVAAPAPITIERRFAEPIATAEAIHHWLAGLVDELCVVLAAAGLGARALLFVAGRVDASAQLIRVGLARPVRAPAHLLRLIARRIETIDPGYGIESLALHVRRAEPLGAEALGPALAEEQAPDLAPLVDALANRIGAGRLWRARAVESDVPERTVAAAPPLDPPDRAAPLLRSDDVRRLDTRARDHPWHPRWPRPARLLRRPEPVDHVLAQLPDQPPVRFTWRGRRHVVVRADGPERIHGEWWRRSAERHAVRDYFQVEDEEGRRFWLFRRGDGIRPETGDLSWYIHGAFG